VPTSRSNAASRRATALVAAGLVGLAGLGVVGACARRGADTTPEGPASQMQAEARVREAIRRSSEGVIMLPSRKAERVFELPRLNDIAQALRQPFAACFLRRAIVTMRPRDPGPGFDHVPEGQAKIRARISPNGQVVRAEVLDSGFADPEMEACLTTSVRRQHFPENKSGNTHYIDVVYWVSLGAQKGVDQPEFQAQVRRESIQAAVRAKPCLQGRIDAGGYVVDSLNLIDREGTTLINRVEDEELPEPVRACVAQAFREVRLPRDSDAFVRPVASRVTFDVSRDGGVGVQGEQWLHLLELEEAAKGARRVQDELGEVDRVPPEVVVEGPGPVGLGAAAPGGRTTRAASPAAPATRPPPADPDDPAEPAGPPPSHGADPGKGGLRLDLGGRGPG
jgi:hypothetical protein